jgi:hypothetical protein
MLIVSVETAMNLLSIYSWFLIFLQVKSDCSNSMILKECGCFDLGNKFGELFDTSGDLKDDVMLSVRCDECKMYTKVANSSEIPIEFINCTESEEFVAYQYVRKNFAEFMINKIDLEGNATVVEFDEDEIELMLSEKELRMLEKYNHMRITKVITAESYFKEIENQKLNISKLENIVIKILNADFFENLTEIFAVSLKNDSIEILPEKLLNNFTKLHGLDLSFNKIMAIPDYFFIDSSLEYLWLSHNNLKSISK